MKKLGIVGLFVIAVVIVLAALSAGKMGETSHAFARGKVVLDPTLMSHVQRDSTLFIVMSSPDRPMPLGALRKKIDPSKGGNIYSFTLTRDNMQMMMATEGVPEKFKLKARLDVDGQAGPDQPGDLVGEVAEVTRGQNDIEIIISKRIPEVN